MSCQQVPRLTEDPYTFTETVPVTATIFNPQTHRLAPIIARNSNNLNQKQILAQKLSTPTLQTRIIQQPVGSTTNVRINGLHKLANGFHKPATILSNAATNTKSPQIQYMQQKQVIGGNVANVITKKFLQPAPPPPVPSLNSLSYQSYPLYSAAKSIASASSTPVVSTGTAASSTTVPLPPLFQKGRPTPGAQILTSISVFPKQQAPSITSVASAEQTLSQRNHSNVNVSRLTPVSQVRGTSQISPSTMTATSYGGLPQFSVPISSPVNIVRKPPPPAQQSPTVVNRTPQTSASADVKPTTDSKKRKSSESDQSVFVTPVKRPAASSGKKGTRAHSTSGSRAKRSYSQTSHHEALQRISSSANTEWHAPDSYIFDNSLSALHPSTSRTEENYDLAPCVQTHWIDSSEIMKSLPVYAHITREQRIELRKGQLRRQAMQYVAAQKFHTIVAARKRLQCVAKALRKLRERDEAPPPKKCCFPSCVNDALAMTAYCYLHITRNSDQYLFLPCTAKFSDNSQCRVPVFDISHELPLCREHAWKRDNYNRIIQEQKPKKPPRKRPKPSAMTRPLKRNKKKRKSSTTSDSGILITTPPTMVSAGGIPPLITKSGYQLISDEIRNSISRSSTIAQQTHIDMLSMCDNSSTYESSEDTGVGGLSESELMVGTHEIAEEIPLGDTRLLEEHDLTNVLNQLPVDAFNELFTTVQQNGPLEPTQEEQEDLERALEAVNKQVKSLQQLTGGDAAFLGDFLDVVDDQILDEADIAEVVLHSPNSSSIETDDTGNIIITSACATDIRGLVQT